MEKNMEILYSQLVAKPIAIVPMMAIGMVRSGCWTSSARWVAQSRHAKAQLVLMRPTIKAMMSESQPVLFSKCAKTKRGD